VSPADLAPSSAGLYILNGHDEAVRAAAAAIQAFVAAGGGLLIGSHTWSWAGQVAEHPTNLVLTKMGILVTSSTFEGTVLIDTSNPPPQTANVKSTLDCVEGNLLDNTQDACYVDPSVEDGLNSLFDSVTELAALMPFDGAGNAFWARIDKVIAAGAAAVGAAAGLLLPLPLLPQLLPLPRPLPCPALAASATVAAKPPALAACATMSILCS